MYIVTCDICKRTIIGNDPGKDATMRVKDLFGSRTFQVLDPVDDEPNPKELTLCTDCKDAMYYYMRNRRALAADVQSMELMNRVRFLLKKPLKIKGGADDD